MGSAPAIHADGYTGCLKEINVLRARKLAPLIAVDNLWSGLMQSPLDGL
ncbi:type IV secretory pathway, VirB3 components [Moorella thermoacetica Y72]|uniref:Type IV secretory pathway, VirB3 components n=1 Tax=Moorella thermoacetica Y72 TaxID=1325331 RepID=A0A061M237_NEOTH|nr:type IV secretory pathway, VirB3 components [Moorella thermoacetica Y72]